MRKAILEIYALAVCFFTVACFVITLGLALWDVVELSVPEFTISSHQYECHQTDKQYRHCFAERSYSQGAQKETMPEGKTLTEQRKEDYQRILRGEQRDAFQGLIQKLIILLVDTLVFYVHWVLARRARQTTD